MKYKHFKCLKCTKISTAAQWNAETRTLCTTPMQKKQYKNIQDAGHGERWYKCPKCGKASLISVIGKVLESEANQCH